MNTCDPHDIPLNNCPPIPHNRQEYAQNLPSNLFNEENGIDGCQPAHQFGDVHRKVNHRCLHSLGPPPRPFKKARYAWEIKNYDYTVKKMTQNVNLLPTSTVTTPVSEKKSSDLSTKETPLIDNSPTGHSEISNYCAPISQTCSPTPTVQDGKNPEMHMIGPPHQGGFVGPLLPTSYHAHYGAIMGLNPTHQSPLSHGEQLSSFHAQIPPDPDARLIRWHTRQLCQSIFDNTVNRMLENIGFSPERSQALHPLLVFSLSDDEEREAEVHQRTLETQALTAALHQKGLLPPPPYHYDPLESATTSDYDSSEEESELGEGGPDDISSEQLPLSAVPQVPEEESPYLSLSSQHPSLAHIVNKSHPYLSPNSLFPLKQNTTEACDRNCSPAQNFCDYQKNCDPSNSISPNYSESKENCNNLSEALHSDTKQNEYQTCISRCQSLGCLKEHSGNGNTYDKKLKMDDNENCISSSPKQETLIEGKVERVLDEQNTEIGLEGNVAKARDSDTNDSYFMRNAIHMAIKQQGFQRA